MISYGTWISVILSLKAKTEMITISSVVVFLMLMLPTSIFLLQKKLILLKKLPLKSLFTLACYII